MAIFKNNRFFKGISKNVVILGIASFFTDISSEMIYPVIPIFLIGVLGAPMSIVGLIEGIAESTASILKALSGWMSDKIGRRRPFVVAGYSLSSLAKPILSLAYFWPTVLIARFLDRFGKGLRTSSRDAMIADSSEVAYRGKAFGFHRAMDSLGACIGPLLAIWFLTTLKENLRIVFLISFIPALIAVLILIIFLKEKSGPVKDDDLVKKSFFLNRKHMTAFSPNFKRFILVSSIFAIGNSSDAFLIIRSKGLGFSVTTVIFLYVLYNISYSLSSAPFGILSDKIPRKSVMAIGYGIFALVYSGFAFIKDPRMAWLLFPVYGFYISMTDGVGKALVSDMVGRQYRATALGFYHFILGIFSFFASLIAGLLWTHVSASAPFIYGAVTAIASVILLVVLIK